MANSKLVHNNFFMKVFESSENVKDFLSGFLPQKIVKDLDLNSITTEKSSYIDEKLQAHLSDLVIKLNTKKGSRTDVYILFEHKSYMDYGILSQLLRYQYLMIMEDLEAHKKPRIILPVVFYHGDRKWLVEKNLSDSMKVPENIKKYVLNFEYMLFDSKGIQMNLEKRKFLKLKRI